MTGTDAAVTPTLRTGLQEWAACCRVLAAGRGMLMVRKGGIHERGGGLFQPEHERFLLMPSWLHQARERLKPAHADQVAADPAPGRIRIDAWGAVAGTWKAPDLARVRALGDELIWSDAELATRFAYRDQPWLYVLALRVHRLPQPVEIADEPAYAGCRSWVPLQVAIDTAGSRPVIDDDAFAARLAAVARTLEPA